MGNDPLAQRAGECLPAYIARLEALDRSRFDEDGQLALTLSLSLARKKSLRQLPHGPKSAFPTLIPSLEGCKQVIRGLTAGERQQLLRWMTGGMAD